MNRLLAATLLSAIMAILGTAYARDGDEAPAPRSMTIRPAAAPVPALKYRLLPEPSELAPGNAAIFYHRAIESFSDIRSRRVNEARNAKKSPGQINEEETKLQEELSQPLSSFPKEIVRGYLDRHSFSLREIELGAWREYCDWELRHRDEGFTLIINEIQESRNLGRLVVLKARLELAEGRVDSAFHWLRTGFSLARHVGEGNIFIQSLVSAAITMQMADVLEELIQAPGAPNFYWALVNRPRPFLDLTAAVEGERSILEKEFPRLKDLDSGPWTLDQARAFADELKRKYGLITGMNAWVSSPTARPQMKDLDQHLLFTTIVARAYPESKRELIAQGRPASVVEAMPAIQVVALHSYQLYKEARDDIFKWGGLPYWQGYAGFRKADEQPRLGWIKLKSGIPFVMVLPAIGSIYVVQLRTDRRLDVIQAIEAIRLHAAGHQGRLPASLDDIDEAPVPLDAATGKPFVYQTDGDTARLTAGPPPGWKLPQYEINYELKLAR